VPTGTIDPTYNKGPLFWYRLDESVFAELEIQYASFKADSLSSFPGDVCFGLAQTVTAMKPAYLDRLIEFLTEAAKQGYSPARAVYAQIVRAHDLKSNFDENTLNRWMFRAISEGYLFAEPSSNTSTEEITSAQERFRRAGGYCSDPFLQKATVVDSLRQRVVPDKPTNSVDHVGNTMLHVSASLGLIDTVKLLVEEHGVPVDVQNDNFETPLYKACQAGHADVLYYLLNKGAKGALQTKTDRLTPLHWLFVFPQEHIYDVARQLTSLGGADVNAVMRPSSSEAANKFPRKVPIAHL
jgi:Ankyrin repeats (many copies)